MARTALQPSARVVRGVRSDRTTPGRAGTDALASVGPRGEMDVSTITTRRAGEVVVDLARAEPAHVGTVVVDLAQADSLAPGAVPSWPSVLRLTEAFGSADLIDVREGSTP